MENYIEDKKKLYLSILEFFKNADEKNDDELNEDSFQKLTNLVQLQEIEGDREEMLQFLSIIKSIGDNYHGDQYFNEKINQILLHYKDQIKQTFSNIEIFKIFESNKKIVLFLLKNDILEMTEPIYREMISKFEKNGIQYWHFFIPEIENLIGKDKMKFIKRELLAKNSRFFNKYEEKRQEGENDSYICSLIRHDNVDDFISYLHHQNILHSSIIKPSIFETNQFLNEYKNTSLIEYSAFFGSVRIFNYLLMNKAKSTSRLLLFAIHSKNAEIIQLTENIYHCDIYCFIESIKCHHNNISDYIKSNLSMKTENSNAIILNYIKYYNYSHFQISSIINHGFFYLNYYHYYKLSKLLLELNEKANENKIIQYKNILIEK